MAVSCAGAGPNLATGEVLVPATEVTAHLPSGLKWKKENVAREEEKKFSKERRQSQAKGKNELLWEY